MPCELQQHKARREQQQLNNAARYALLHGTPEEARQVERLIAAVDHGHLERHDALAVLRDLRRLQQHRHAA